MQMKCGVQFFLGPNLPWPCRTSRFDSVEPNILYSGADDCTFKAWDVRISQSKPLWINRTELAGWLVWLSGLALTWGITTFETSSQWPHVLMVGGYNEKVVAWDLRRPVKQELCSIGVGTLPFQITDLKTWLDGGVWRIRSRASDSLLAVAAMRGYFRMLDFDSSGFSLRCLGIHNEVIGLTSQLDLSRVRCTPLNLYATV